MSQVLSNINEYVLKPLSESIRSRWSSFRDRNKVTSVGVLSSTINIYANGQFVSVPRRKVEVYCHDDDVVVKPTETGEGLSSTTIRIGDKAKTRKLVRMIYKQSRPLYLRAI